MFIDKVLNQQVWPSIGEIQQDPEVLIKNVQEENSEEQQNQFFEQNPSLRKPMGIALSSFFNCSKYC